MSDRELALRAVGSLRDDDDEGRARMSEARSSYVACVSRGFWPKRPKAHGAAVAVGNREKEAGILDEEEEDIFWVSRCWWCVRVGHLVRGLGSNLCLYLSLSLPPITLGG